jgi:H+/gluconate symporter-like permease
MTLSIVGVILALGLLAFMAMRGYNILLNAIVCAAVVALLSGMNLYNALLQDFMTGFVNFFKSWFFTFLVGTIFGMLMEQSGAARGIALGIVKLFGRKRALLAVVLSTGIIAYGGVSVFVVVFTIFPIAYHLFREANLPRRFIGATIVFGSITFAMTCPGTPQIHNLVPVPILGTTPMAGMVIGFVVAAGMLVTGQIILEKMIDSELKKHPEGFVAYPSDKEVDLTGQKTPNALISLLPLVASLVMLNVFKFKVEPSVSIGIIVGIVALYKYFDIKTFPKLFTDASKAATLAIANTCAVNGFGMVVRNAPAFENIREAMTAIPGPPLLGAAIATCVIAGICGSASGGITIALPLLWPIYQPMGVDPNAFHRVMSIACGGLDSLPHNGYVVTALNGVCGTTHKQGYMPILWLTVIMPMVWTLIAILLFTLFPSLP